MIDAALFGANPRVFCDIAEWNGEAVGFAFWFLNFSTFSGKSGLYLEDLFVRPEHRGKGIGKALMIHLARRSAPRTAGGISSGRCSTGTRPRSISTIARRRDAR